MPYSDWGVWQGSCQCKTLSALFVSKPAPARSLWVEYRILHPFICPSGSPNNQGGLPPLYRTPGLACPDSRVRVHLCGPSFDFSQSWRSQPYAFFLSYLVTWKSFLQLWLYRSSSASFQFSLRIVSYVGVLWMCLCWGGEPRILPFCHPDPSCLCYLLIDCLGCGSYHGLMLIQISFLLTIVENLSGMRNHFVLIKFSLTHRL